MNAEQFYEVVAEILKRDVARSADRPPRKVPGRLRRLFDRAVGTSLLLAGGSIGGIGVMYLVIRRLDDLADLPTAEKPKVLMEMMMPFADWLEQGNKKLSTACDDCGGWGFGYMLEDTIWATAVGHEHIHFLCIPCVEKRLGRHLVPEDFQRERPINGPVFEAFRIGIMADRMSPQEQRH